MEICDRIKLMRLLCGMKQEELASKAGVLRPSLGNYEQGTYVPRDKSLERLATIFGVEPGYLRYGSPSVVSQVWLPNIPVNVRRKRETIEDILKLLPEFIRENRFTGVVEGFFADGSRTFLFGRNSLYDCLLFTNAELGHRLIDVTKEIDNHKIADNLFGNLESFDADCLSFISWQIEEFGLKLDLLPMRRSLTRLTEIKARKATRLDGVTLVHEASINELARQGLLKVADMACRELVGEPLEKFVAGHNITIPDVLTYSDQLSKSLCVILKAACDLLTKERHPNPSSPVRQFRMSTIGFAN